MTKMLLSTTAILALAVATMGDAHATYQSIGGGSKSGSTGGYGSDGAGAGWIPDSSTPPNQKGRTKRISGGGGGGGANKDSTNGFGGGDHR